MIITGCPRGQSMKCHAHKPADKKEDPQAVRLTGPTLVHHHRFELWTPWLRVRCSTSWANGAYLVVCINDVFYNNIVKYGCQQIFLQFYHTPFKNFNICWNNLKTCWHKSKNKTREYWNLRVLRWYTITGSNCGHPD